MGLGVFGVKMGGPLPMPAKYQLRRWCAASLIEYSREFSNLPHGTSAHQRSTLASCHHQLSLANQPSAGALQQRGLR